MRFATEHILPRSATEYFHRNVKIGVSQPQTNDVAVLDELGTDFFMWEVTSRTTRARHPSPENTLRQVFPGRSEAVLRKVLAENAAEVYGFDLDALAAPALKGGPTVAGSQSPFWNYPRTPTRH